MAWGLTLQFAGVFTGQLRQVIEAGTEELTVSAIAGALVY